ncbi:MAG: apolipoprotein N-acyltransferase [Endomicrobia bacterium]|nr:apolipoprotein N-acyltransferase [Endomicrobiia bacterium]
MIFFSVLSGLLLFFSYPKYGSFFCAWFCFVPIIYVVQLERRKGLNLKTVFTKLFIYSLVTGLIGYGGIFYWIVPTFKAAGEPVIFGVISLIVIAMYFSLYLYAFCIYTFLTGLDSFTSILSSSLFWVLLEYLQMYLFSGFPWVLLGITQYANTKIIQVADIFGIYGVSFLLIFTNLTISIVANNVVYRKKIRFNYLAIPLILITTSYLYGEVKFLQLNNQARSDKEMLVVLLQGNIDQYKKWDRKYTEEIMNKYTSLITTADSMLKNKYDKLSVPVVYIWPESSVPGWLFEEKYLYNWVNELVKITNKDYKSYHLIGTVRMGQNRPVEYYNSAALFTVENNEVIVKKIYDKIHLVPFGEYVPFRNILGKFVRTVNELGEFSAGKEFVVFDIEGVKFSVLICYESIFPELAAKFVEKGAEFFVNITNDAWFLKTSAPYQHFVFNISRAVENRCYVLRAANTGISGIISPTGKVLNQTKLFEDDVIIQEVKIFHNTTFYTKFCNVLWLLYFSMFIFINYFTFKTRWVTQ